MSVSQVVCSPGGKRIVADFECLRDNFEGVDANFECWANDFE